ncbi:lipase family protein [Marinobacter sp. 1-4A]|uniref:lipase family protein n=1 Tax=Marinobacter sp. 1-4A TaxID=2582919 RepID=UPI0019066D5C|nr:lipase family protein [Marinobacter sp. 1-4A]MBK1850300.1 lipase family protein [Marinobacter sp. 1-4A]
MKSLSPKLAAEFAHIVYGILTPDPTGIVRLETTAEMRKAFNIDLSRGPVTGRTGGLFGLYRRSTGFAVHGEGVGKYRGHHVIAVRGTKTTADWLTNGNFGLSTSVGGASVHAGFNKTFESMEPALERLLSPAMATGRVEGLHCVGHSLGGALASLTADWVKYRFRKPVKLYTFGAPRVGMLGYATAASNRIEGIHRCVHGADPVPHVPLWPFIHAHVNGSEYRLDNASGISDDAHGMSDDDVPGYRNTANVEDWSLLQRRSDIILSRSIRLDYERRHEAFFSGQWADKLSSALITLLKDSGYYAAIITQAAVSSSLTFYDLLARTLEAIASASVRFAEQTRGLLGHMLAFARVAVTTVTDLTFRFIRWVFDQTAGALYRAVRRAIERN